MQSSRVKYGIYSCESVEREMRLSPNCLENRLLDLFTIQVPLPYLDGNLIRPSVYTAWIMNILFYFWTLIALKKCPMHVQKCLSQAVHKDPTMEMYISCIVCETMKDFEFTPLY